MNDHPILVASLPTAVPFPPCDLLHEREVAAMLGVALNTLRNWRWRGEGPRFVKVGKRCVRYRQSDVQAFIEAGAREVAA